MILFLRILILAYLILLNLQAFLIKNFQNLFTIEA